MESGTRAEGTTVSRDAFAERLADLLAEWGAGRGEALASLVWVALADYDDTDLQRFVERSANTGSDWGYHPPDPVARRISREMMRQVLQPGSSIENADALEVARSQVSVLLGNHLSFVDVNVLDYLMAESGYSDVAERVTALVGPKVFALPIRRIASLCFGTIKLAQSSSRASGEAVMRPRDVAKLAHGTIAAARERQTLGEHLLVFPEGSRSRSGGLERCLAGVARYLEAGDAMVIPWGHAGAERLVPLGEDHVHPTSVRIRIGAPIAASRLLEACSRKRQLVVDVIGFLIAEQVPGPYRGVYGRGSHDFREAREIAETLLA